jgi:hypothetical protein
MNPNPAIYVKIETMSYKTKQVFYRKPINTELHLATEFSRNYEYYYKEETDVEPKYLGKFEGKGMYGGNPYWDNYDYPIIKFEKENIFDNKTEFIYCKGIPDSNDNMCIIEDMEYEEFPVYYQK